MRVHRGLVFWGLALVTAGAMALAITQGYLDRAATSNLWRLWPLILVAIGVAIIAARTPFALLGSALAAITIGAIAGTAVALGPGVAFFCGGGDDLATSVTRSGTFGDSATLEWNFNCASTEVSTTSGAGEWTVSYGTDSAQPSVAGGSDSLSLHSSGQGGFPGNDREHWVVTLPTPTVYHPDILVNGGSLTMDLGHGDFQGFHLQTNAADVRMDLTEANASSAFPGIDFHLNAGKLVIITNDSGASIEGNVEANAGSVILCAPANAPLRITASGTAFGTNLDNSDLQRTGDTWESAAYANANPNQTITLTVRGNASSFDLNPEEGC